MGKKKKKWKSLQIRSAIHRKITIIDEEHNGMELLIVQIAILSYMLIYQFWYEQPTHSTEPPRTIAHWWYLLFILHSPNAKLNLWNHKSRLARTTNKIAKQKMRKRLLVWIKVSFNGRLIGFLLVIRLLEDIASEYTYFYTRTIEICNEHEKKKTPMLNISKQMILIHQFRSLIFDNFIWLIPKPNRLRDL